MKNRFETNRRTFLKAAGLGAGAAFLPSLARGQVAPRPRRVIVLLTELGWNPAEFRMKPPGAPDEVLLRSDYHPTYSNMPDDLRWELPLTATPRDQFSRTLEPLYDVRDKILALDGLGMLSIAGDRFGDGHAKGWVHALSGHPSGGYITGQRAVGGAPSIEARIARHLRAQEPALTDLVAIRAQVTRWWGTGGTGGFHHWFYDFTDGAEVVRTPVLGNPGELFDRLFPTGSAPGQSASAVQAGQRSVLDQLSERYRATFPRLSRADRNKLSAHQQRISDIQQRLDRLAQLRCEAPARPEQDRNLSIPDFYMSNLDTYFDLVVTAMACDITRVAALHLTNSGNEVNNAFYGAADLDFHEWYSHGTNPPKRWFGVEGANVSQAEFDKYQDAAPVLAQKNRFHMTQLARLMARLDAVPEGEGTLLDHTAIVVMDEISHGSHGHDQWPVVLAGGFGGQFRTGRYIRFARNLPNPGINAMRYVGHPHSHLLVSLCQGMGVPLEHMGIDHVFARPDRHHGSGQRISLAGPLTELT